MVTILKGSEQLMASSVIASKRRLSASARSSRHVSRSSSVSPSVLSKSSRFSWRFGTMPSIQNSLLASNWNFSGRNSPSEWYSTTFWLCQATWWSTSWWKATRGLARTIHIPPINGSPMASQSQYPQCASLENFSKKASMRLLEPVKGSRTWQKATAGIASRADAGNTWRDFPQCQSDLMVCKSQWWWGVSFSWHFPPPQWVANCNMTQSWSYVWSQVSLSRSGVAVIVIVSNRTNRTTRVPEWPYGLQVNVMLEGLTESNPTTTTVRCKL